MAATLIIKQSLGLDISKDSISACMAQRELGKSFRILGTRKFDNSTRGFRQMELWLGKWAKKDVVLQILMEATGVYFENCIHFFLEQGYHASVILPNKSKAYARSLDYKSKTDKIDSKILAQLGLERQFSTWGGAEGNILKIKRLCRERVELLQEKTAVSNRLHARKHSYKPDNSAIKRAKTMLSFIQKQIKEVEKAIEQAVSEDAQISSKVALLCSIKGVALITAATIIGETNGFALFENKAQVVSYAGYDVVQNESGTSLKAQTYISKKGNAFIRRALHFPALCTIKHVKVFKDLYERVFERTKIKMKAAVAVQRKLLALCYTLYKKGENFDPQYQQKVHTKMETKNRQEQLSAPA
jgi:transposase